MNCATLAVPTNIMSAEKNTIRCKVRTSPRCYNNIKSARFGICLYVKFRLRGIFSPSIADTGSGDKREIKQVANHCTLFRALSGAHNRTEDKEIVVRASPSVAGRYTWVISNPQL